MIEGTNVQGTPTSRARAAVAGTALAVLAIVTLLAATPGSAAQRRAHAPAADSGGRALASVTRTATRNEVAGPGGAGTFTNYTNAGGTLGQRIAPYQAVQVTCALTGFRVADGNTWWYQVASSPWNNAFYTPADDFYNNGATSGSLNGTPFVDPAVPICGSGGGGDTGGGGGGTTTTTTTPPPPAPNAAWQVSGPDIGGSLELGSAYVLRFGVKNVGNATGTFTINASADPTCTSSQTASNVAPGATAQLKFVCFHKWQWIEPYNTGYSKALNDVLGHGTQMWQSLKSKIDFYKSVTDALGVLRIPARLASSIETFNTAVDLANLLNDDYNTLRPLGLILQNKIWAKSYTTNFSYSAPSSGATPSLTATLYVPSYKWAAYGNFTWTATSSVAFAIAGQIAAILYPKVSWVSWMKPLLLAAKQGLPYLARKGLEASKAAYAAAYDPDPDYTTAPQVTYQPTTALDGVPDGPMKDYFVAMSHAMDVEAARDQAYIRYAGAMEAQDTAAAALQMDALQTLTSQEESLLQASPAGEQEAMSVLPADFTPSDQQAVLDAFASPDFASSEVGQAMVAGDATAQDVTTLAQAVAQNLVTGDSFDLGAAVEGAVDGGGSLLNASAVDATERLGGAEAGRGLPTAQMALDKPMNADGTYDGPVTVTITPDPNAAPTDHLEYSLDGGAFSRYAGPVVVSASGQHTLAARAVATDGTVQDPATQLSITIAPQHVPPVAAIANPFVVADTSKGLPATVTLDGTPSRDVNSDPLTYQWTFDDGGTSDNPTGATVTHTFAHYGVFTARLTVSNGFYSSLAQASIDVADATPPTVAAPADAAFVAGPHAQEQIAAWLASAVAHDDDPAGSVVVTNDFGGMPAVGRPDLVTWTATDAAGNVAHSSATLTIVDGTPPVIEPEVSGPLGSDDWYTGDVHVAWQVSDPESAIASQSGCDDITIASDSDGAGIAVTCTAQSDGGTSSQTVRVKRDATPPTIEAARAPAPNAAGWSNTDVTVTFACADAGAGVAQCSSPAVLREGSDQSATGVAVDGAGNTANATLDHVNVDETAPTLSGVPTTAPSPSGWYTGDVTVHWTCADGGSGIDGACPADSTIDGEGAGLAATAHASDRAGNETSAASQPVKIDRTPPQTTIAVPSAWARDDVTVTLAATDALSGVAGTHVSVDGGETVLGNSVTISEEGRHTVAYWSTDNAGNVEDRHTATVLIDKTAPAITSGQSPTANAAGWNNTDVSVSFACSDALSGIAFCSPTQLLTREGRGISVSGQAADNAGNTAAATAVVSIDKTAPTITAAADRLPNAAGWYNADVAVGFTCSDALSGVAACSPPVTLKEGADQTARGTGADAAGNAASAARDHINVDETVPVVSYAGNVGVYTVDQSVAITCSTADTLSGVASTTCANIAGAAWTFGLGTTSRSAAATDRAGNTGTGSVSFVVRVTCSSLEALVARFSTDTDVTTGLDAKVEAICAAPNANAKSGKLAAFDNQVAAQTGKALTAGQADELALLAAAL